VWEECGHNRQLLIIDTHYYVGDVLEHFAMKILIWLVLFGARSCSATSRIYSVGVQLSGCENSTNDWMKAMKPYRNQFHLCAVAASSQIAVRLESVPEMEKQAKFGFGFGLSFAFGLKTKHQT
jgi:uncharacterized protein Smg (DUF494 family)